MDLIIGLATYNARERSAWRMALMHAGATVWPCDLPALEPQVSVDAWVVVLDRLSTVTLWAAWLSRLSARALLISPKPTDAWYVSTLVPYPVIVSDPATGATVLRTQLQLLLDMTAGQVWFERQAQVPCLCG
jgi:hypothetical protein